MFKPFAMRVLMGLPLVAMPCLAQGTTHLNVPAKQIVSIRFVKGVGDGPGQFSGFYLQRADSVSLGGMVPAGQALIIWELSIARITAPAPAISR